MSDYIRDRFQGVGAVAAAAPAPRSAPAPTIRPAAGGGPMHLATPKCPSSRWRKHRLKPGQIYCDCRAALGASDVRDNEGGGGAGTDSTTGTQRRPGVQYIQPVVYRKPPTQSTPSFSSVVQPRPFSPTVGGGAVLTTAPTHLPPGTTSGGLPVPNRRPPSTSGGGGAMLPDGGGEITIDQALPSGAQFKLAPGDPAAGTSKLWLAGLVAGVAYVGYRHLKRRRRR